MAFRLGVSTGFAVNRFSEPEEWTQIVRDSGINYVQFTADMLNVALPKKIVAKQTDRIIQECLDKGLKISSTFTGAFTRVNHLAHPDTEIRNYWINWFKLFADLTVQLGSKVMGSHFGIYTMRDDRDPSIRRQRRTQNIKAWHQVAAYARDCGIEQILWEPMSISREQGETLIECRKLQDDVNLNSPLPFKICLDVEAVLFNLILPDVVNFGTVSVVDAGL